MSAGGVNNYLPEKYERCVELTEVSQPVIIAMKGLPCTGKSEIARLLGWWARCPVLYIDQFLDALSLEKGYTAELLPSPEEVERLHHLAFVALCKAASNTLQWGVDSQYCSYKCIIVKARLCSNFELDQLLQIARERGCGMILIIEFRMKNKYRFRVRLERKVESGRQKEWYKPRSWKDIEKANDDYEANSNDWVIHLRRLLNNNGDHPLVTRLLLDPFDDLHLDPSPILLNLTSVIINFLLMRDVIEDLDSNNEGLFLKGRYVVVQYGEVGRYLREMSISGPRINIQNHKYNCYALNWILACNIKYWEEVEDDHEGKPYYCGVCEEPVISGKPAYGCHYCTLTLHKSCAEVADDFTLEGYQDLENLRFYPVHLPQTHACKSCFEGGKNFSYACRSCHLQTHLKCQVLPTILKHDSDQHFLFIYFQRVYKCNACGIDRHGFGGSYGCYLCFKYYDIECISLAKQGEHEHGGHQHLLKLLYSRDGMEEEESYWCDICYEDIDPQNWFYSCQDCPYFSAHPNCARHSIRHIQNLKKMKANSP